MGLRMAHCPTIQQLYTRHLGIPPAAAHSALESFLLLGREAADAIQQRALATYALYRCHNGLRPGGLAVEDLDGAFHGVPPARQLANGTRRIIGEVQREDVKRPRPMAIVQRLFSCGLDQGSSQGETLKVLTSSA